MPILERRRKKLKNSLKKLPYKMKSLSLRFKNQLKGGRLAPKIAFWVNGGMGDHVLAARFIRDFVASVGSVDFDVYCNRPAIGQWLFDSIDGCGLVADRKANIKILQKEYLYIINTLTFAEIVSERKHRSLTGFDEMRLDEAAERIKNSCKPIQSMINGHPQLDGYLGHYAVLKKLARHNFLHAMAGIEYSGDEVDIEVDEYALKKWGLNDQAYITLSNGYDEEVQRSKEQSTATKVYPYFDEVVAGLRAKVPDLMIVQVGTSTSTPVAGVSQNLVGKTSLKEVAAILQGSRLHIDNEGGLVHLAKALGTKSCVVFGPTSAAYFGYTGNINIEPPVCGGCWWMEPTWMSTCVKGDLKPSCMYEQKPEWVSKKIIDELMAHAAQDQGLVHIQRQG